MGFVEMKNTQKVFAASALVALAGTAFAQVTPGSFTPDAVDNMESYPGGRVFIGSLFGGSVPVVASPLSLASINIAAGDTWFDFRSSPAPQIQPTSGTKFGSIFGFGGIELNFAGIGGISAFSASLCAAGFGVDTIEFFDLDGNNIGTFQDFDGFGAGGIMETQSFTSTVAIGRVRIDGPETTIDDVAYAQGDLPAQILLYSEGLAEFRHEQTAADSLGLNYDHIISDTAALNSAIASGDYRFAIIHQPANNFAAGFDGLLSSFVSGGNRVHFSFWNLDASPSLQSTLGVASAVDFFAPRPVFNNASHPSWGAAPSPVAVSGSDPWNDNGDLMTAASGAEVVSTFDSTTGQGATIVANNNKTLVNGFEYDSMNASGVTRLLIAQIDWVRTAAPPPPPPRAPGGAVPRAAPNPHHHPPRPPAGRTPDLRLFDDFFGLTNALNNPDFGLAVISNPCCFFDAGTPGALATFVANGNHVHMSFWNMDAEPSLQATMGIASAFDFFDPRPVFQQGGHPSWGAVTSVPVDPAFSPWFDNGDTMTPAAGGTVVGVFDAPGSGQGAIIVANGDRTLFNGFDYDSLDTSAVTNLVAAQLSWIGDPCGAGCYADCDGDGILTIFDFLCFQNAFATSDPYADCDGDGLFTIFDFLCFQNAFAVGCD